MAEPKTRRSLPLFDDLRSYDRSWLSADLVAAVTVWAIVVPESMAYASIAGMPPATGLYAASVPLLAYALLGSSRRMSYGPTASVAALSAATIAPLAGGDMERFVALSTALAIGVGVVLVLAGIAKLGVIAEFLSGPVLIGFLSGVALTIMVGQLDKVLEVEVEGEGFFEELWSAFGSLEEANLSALAVAVGTYLVLEVLHRISKRIPGALVVVIAGIAASAALGWDSVMHVVGDVEGGFPRLAVPDIGFSDLSTLVAGAVGIGIVVYGESMALAKAFGKPHREKVDGDQELIATGAANVVGGFFGAFVTAGSNSRTAAADTAGQRTQVSSIIVGVAVLVTAVFLTPLFESLPEAVLGALVIHAVIGLVKVRPLTKLYQRNRADFAAAIATFIGVLVLDVLAGLLVGIFLSVALLMARAAKPHIATLAKDPTTGHFHDVERLPDDVEPHLEDGITILRFDAGLFFANAAALTDAIDEAAAAGPRAIILDAEAITEVDTTAAEALEGTVEALAADGIGFAVARMRRRPADDLANCGLDISPFSYDRVQDAVDALRGG